VTRLRKMMLEELGRNYSENTTRYYIRTVEDFSRDSTYRRTAWARGTFVNTKRSYFKSKSCRRVPLRTTWRHCGFSTSRRSRRAGALPRLPIREDHFTFR
jgi:hypothetical protein